MKFVRKQDKVVHPGASQLHFKGDKNQRTVIGGLASLLVTFYLYFIIFDNGIKMVRLRNNSISSLVDQMHYDEVGKAFLNQTAKPLLEILERGDSTIDLESENYKRYINIRVNNKKMTFDDDGELIEQNDFFPVTKCSEYNFQKTDFEKEYWK